MQSKRNKEKFSKDTNSFKNEKKIPGRFCSNCETEDTPVWRKGKDGEILCNSCGLYWAKNGHNPKRKEMSTSVKKPNSIDALRASARSVHKRLKTDRDEHSNNNPYQTPMLSPLDLSKMTERQQIAYLMSLDNQNQKSRRTSDRDITEDSESEEESMEDEEENSFDEEGHSDSGEAPPAQKANPELERAKGDVSQNELLCSICESTGDLLMCEGTCKRSFHISCWKEKEGGSTPRLDSAWTCKHCKTHSHQCFKCKNYGKDDVEVLKCKEQRCGKYYHWNCLKTVRLNKIVNTQAKRFLCALHFCSRCKLSIEGKPFMQCFRCPVAYHNSCLPAKAKTLMTDKKSHKGYLICQRHRDDQRKEKGESDSSPETQLQNKDVTKETIIETKEKVYKETKEKVYKEAKEKVNKEAKEKVNKENTKVKEGKREATKKETQKVKDSVKNSKEVTAAKSTIKKKIAN